MPVQVLFYRDGREVPVLDWLSDLPKNTRERCLDAIRQLGEHGHELRRPHADFLERGIYELRVRVGRVNFRILYFFSGQEVVVLAQGLTKERAIPPVELTRALHRKAEFERAPAEHAAEVEL